MSKMFDDLMKGLDEVEAYLNGTETGYRVHEPEALNRALGREEKPPKRAQSKAARSDGSPSRACRKSAS